VALTGQRLRNAQLLLIRASARRAGTTDGQERRAAYKAKASDASVYRMQAARKSEQIRGPELGLTSAPQEVQHSGDLPRTGPTNSDEGTISTRRYAGYRIVKSTKRTQEMQGGNGLLSRFHLWLFRRLITPCD
jgi:hypothetical protein